MICSILLSNLSYHYSSFSIIHPREPAVSSSNMPTSFPPRPLPLLFHHQECWVLPLHLSTNPSTLLTLSHSSPQPSCQLFSKAFPNLFIYYFGHLLYWTVVFLFHCFCLYLYSSIYYFKRENNLPSTVKKNSLQFYLVKNLLELMVGDINLLLHIIFEAYGLPSWWFQRHRFCKAFEQSVDSPPRKVSILTVTTVRHYATQCSWTDKIIYRLFFIYLGKL